MAGSEVQGKQCNVATPPRRTVIFKLRLVGQPKRVNVHTVLADVKPENILLSLEKASLVASQAVIPSLNVVAKLCDFGLSARLPPGATHLSFFNGHGTPFWVAPEVSLQ
jgi:hypothetical protein